MTSSMFGFLYSFRWSRDFFSKSVRFADDLVDIFSIFETFLLISINSSIDILDRASATTFSLPLRYTTVKLYSSYEFYFPFLFYLKKYKFCFGFVSIFICLINLNGESRLIFTIFFISYVTFLFINNCCINKFEVWELYEVKEINVFSLIVKLQ